MKPTLLLTAILLTATSVAQTAGWTALTPMATARKGAVAFSIGTKGYICTGEDASGNKLKDLWEFNASTLLGTQVWTQRASLDAVAPARSGAAGFAVQGNGYMGTGEDANGNRLSDFYKYDPIANSWSTIQSLPGLGRSEAVGFAVGDKGYAGLGKFDATGTIANTDFYELNPITGNWSVRAQFPVPGPRIGAVGFGIGFHGFVGTGLSGTTLMDDFWLYDPPPSNQWVQRSTFPGSARAHATGFSLVGYGFIGTGNDGGNLVSDFYRYNPDDDSWTEADALSATPREGAVGFSIGDRGFLCTGDANGALADLWQLVLPIDCNGVYGGPDVPGTSCDDGDAGTIHDKLNSGCTCTGTPSNRWVQGPDVSSVIENVGRLGAVSFTLGIYGYIALGQEDATTYNKDVWRYGLADDPEDGIVWTQVTTFPGKAYVGAAAFSIDHKGYICTGAGSYNISGAPVASKELWEFDQFSQNWTRKADFPDYPRHSATGFSLDGKGYVGLGHDSLDAVRSDFWRFDPTGGPIENGGPMGTWDQVQDFPPGGRANAVSFTVGNRAFVGTGNDGANSDGNSYNDLWELDPNGLWHSRTALPAAARYNAVAFGLGNKGYLGTGEWHTPPVSPSTTPQLHVTDDFWEFDPSSTVNGTDGGGSPMGSWTHVADFGGSDRYGAVGFAMGFGEYAKGYIGTGNHPLVGSGSILKDFWEYTPTIDCEGVFQGPARPGKTCDDNNQFTSDDVYNANCQCKGTCSDADHDDICDGIDDCYNPSFPGMIGSNCIDGDTCTVGDVLDDQCACHGILRDNDFDGIPNCADNCPATPGTQGGPCDDGDPCTTGTTLDLACICTGGSTVPDSDNDGLCNTIDVCPNTPPDEIGSINSDGCSCGDMTSQFDDNDPCTLDVCASGVITHTVQDADGDGTCDHNDPCPLLANKVPGDPCDDGDPCTVNETITSGCLCVGTNNSDTDGDGACDLIDPCPLLANLVPGDPCNDDSQSTSNDEVTNGCECLGTPLPPPSDWIYRGDDPLVNRRFGAVAFTIGDVAYFGGGADVNGATNDFYSYDPVNGWQSINDPIPGGPRIYSVAFSSGGKGYVGTGNDNLFYEYDPANGGSWTQVTEPLPGPVRVHATSFTINDMGYVGLGQTAGPVFFRDFYKFVPGPDPGSGTWVPIDQFPAHQVWLNGQFYDTGIAFATGFSVGGTGYVCGGAYDNTNGESFTPLNELWAYTPGSGWVPKASLPIGNRIFATSFSIGDKGYVGTGLSYPFALNDDFYEYDPALNTWTERDPYSGRRRSGASGFSINGKGYITGGVSSGAYNSDLWEYDPINEAGWTQRHAFNGGGRDGASSFSIGGMGYVFGGQNTETFFNDLWRYNPTTDSWTQSASMLDGAPRSFAMAFSIGNDGYVGTGRTASSGSNSIDYIADDFFRYDAVGNQWTAIGAFPGGRRFGGTAFTIAGVAYAGMGDAGINDGGIQADMYKYDPTQGWSYSSLFGNGLGDGRAYASAFTANDKGYVAMGATPNGSNSNELWQFDPVTNGWTPMLSCPGPGRFAASSFAVGELGYIVTGRDQQDLFNDAWEYNTTSGSWTERASPGPLARWGATAFAIGGIGYLTTGRYADGSFSVDTRMYTPSQEPDCLGVTGGPALPGTPCDVDPCMIEQIWDANCTCTGGGPNLVDLDNDLLVDCTEQCPGTPFGEITNADGCSCSQLNTDDSDPCTTDNCVDGVVSHVPIDTDGDGIPDCTDSCPGLFGQEGAACGGTACLSPGTIVNCVCNATAINPQLGDTYATRIPITLDNAGNATVSGNNLPCFTSTYTGPNAQTSPDVWYSITTGACAPGNMIVSLCGGGTSFDTYLHLLDASGTTQLAYNDDGGPICTGTKSSLSYAIAPNTTYIIVVEGFNAYTGTFTLDVSIPGLTADADSDGIPDGCDSCTPGLEYAVASTTFAPLANTGTSVTLADDQLSGALPIGFAFNFYGTNYTNFHISSNGWMTFTPGQQPAHAAQALPSTPSSTVPSNLIAAAWMDLNPAAGGSINYATTGTSPNQVLTVTWTAVPLYQNVTITATVQIQLHEGSNAIEIHSTSVPVTLFAKTQGIQNSNGTVGLASPGRNQTTWTATNDAYRFTPHATGPGATCDDGLVSTTNDLLNSNCVCVGTPIGNGQPEISVEHPVGTALSGVVAWGDGSYGATTAPVSAQTGVTAIAGGQSFSVALKSDGSVIAWGNNSHGETNLPLTAQSGVTAISAGAFHTLALKNDGSVVSWGDNSAGQTTVPTEAQSGVTAVAAGRYHSLALKSNGSVVAWGYYAYGQSNVPAEAQSGIIAIADGEDFSMALKSDGGVIAWGSNDAAGSDTDVPSAAQSGVVAIAAGSMHALALKGDGSVIAWGYNFQGQTNVPVAAQSGVTAIAAGNGFSMALKSDGSVIAWGNNLFGESNVPASAQTGIAAIAAGSLHALVLKNALVPVGFIDQAVSTTSAAKTFTIHNTGNANLTSIALNKTGADPADFTLDTGGMLSTLPPGGSTTFSVTFTPGATGARACTLHIVSNDNNENPYSIGLTGNGVPLDTDGDGVPDASDSCPYVVGQIGSSCDDGSASTINDILRANCTCFGTLALPEISVEQPAGTALTGVIGWGENGLGQSTAPPGAQSDIIAVSAGFEFSLALKTNGSVIAWGNNNYGQTVVPVSAQSGVTAIAAGQRHSMALKSDGSVVAWGDNFFGQLSVPLAAQSGVTAIATKGLHSLALKNDGSVIAWGYNNDGQANVPAEAQSGIVGIAAGQFFSMVLKNDGSVIAWGENDHGQTTVPIEAQSGVIAIAATVDACFALKSDGSVIDWGDWYPVPLEAQSGVTEIAPGLALKTDGSVIQWPDAAPAAAQSGIASVSGGMGHALALKNALLPVGFGDQSVSTTSAAKTFTIRNTGNANLIGIAVNKTGANPSDFTLDTGGMLSTLPPGGSTTFTVTFTPGATGARGCTLNVVSNDNNENPYSIGLTGNGVPLDTDGDGVPDATDNCPTVVGQIGSSCDDGYASTTNDILRANCTCFGTLSLPEISVEQPVGTALSGVVAWGGDVFGQSTASAEVQTGVTAVAAGSNHSLALKSDGSVIAWGDNSQGQTAVPVMAQTGVIAIAAGSFHSLALKSDGSVIAWGYNGNGLTAMLPDLQSGVIAIASEGSYSLALKSDGSVFAWDNNYAYMISEAGSGVIAIAAGGGFGLALKSDGSVMAWGTNSYGQTTVPAAAASGVIAIAAGYGHALALKNDGSVVGWGRNADGQTTVPSAAASGVTAIAAGYDHSLALKSDGSVVAWGDNFYGQLTMPVAAGSGITAIAGGATHTLALKNALLPVGFGDQVVSASSSAKTFTIRNTGNASLTGIAVTKSGANSGDFTVNTGGMLTTVPQDGSTTFSVTFTPAATGARGATVHIASNDNNENPYDIDLTGNGVAAPNVQLALKVILEGPYNSATGLMGDNLRTLSSFALTEPFTALGYAHSGGGGGETTTTGVLAVTGNDAIVDWVLLELRNSADPAMILASRSALVQRDGDVVDVDGTAPVSFVIGPGNYYVAVRHRNHLGCMTIGPLALSASPASVDFTTLATATYGTNARKTSTGAVSVQMLWAGDVTFNGVVKYTGSSNDRDPILITVGSTTPNNVVSTYSTRDVNLNGQVKYTGSGNDRDPILVNVGSTTPNNVRVQQLP